MIALLIAFYKVHYNFAAISALFLMWAFFLLLRKNYRWFVIVFAIVFVYNVAMAKKIQKDPMWMETIIARLDSFDFVNFVWEGNAVSKANKSAIKNDKQ